MFTKARQSAASALRSLPAAAPFCAPVLCLAVVALVPIIAVIRIPTPPSDHGKPNVPELVLRSSELFELAEFDAQANSLQAEISTLLEDSAISDQARQLLLQWSIRRFQNTTTPPEEILSDLLGFINRKKKFASCAVVGNSGILLDSDYGASIDSHEAVIRLKNAPIDGGVSRRVGTKTTISFISGKVIHLCYRRRQQACFCQPYGHAVPLILYIDNPSHFIDVAACNSTGKVFVTDPVFDRLCLKIIKLYSLKRWFTGGGSRRFSDWSIEHEGKLFHYSSGMQAVVMAVGVCERVSLYGFGKLGNSSHHYHTSQKAELKIHDYEAEYEFYRDLMKSPARIPFLSSAVGKFKFPPVVVHGWGLV